jgi:hypothetical protein
MQDGKTFSNTSLNRETLSQNPKLRHVIPNLRIGFAQVSVKVKTALNLIILKIIFLIICKMERNFKHFFEQGNTVQNLGYVIPNLQIGFAQVPVKV